MRGPNIEAYRARAGNLRQADLIRLARDLGFTIDRQGGKGSHVKASKEGRLRPVTIPRKFSRRLALEIIQQLEDDDD